MKANHNYSYHDVQWYSVAEWNLVFKLIFGPKSVEEDKRRALQILLVWKARNPLLPSAIESTLGLLEVELQTPIDDTTSTVPDRLLRLMYSSVIMRFINHMLDDAQSKRMTLLQAASAANIPKWIINLRHETAHGHNLPSLSLLKTAAHTIMNWLYEVYWSPQKKLVIDYTTANTNIPAVPRKSWKKLSYMVYAHNLLAVLSNPKLGFTTISDISDVEMRKELISDIRTFNFKVVAKSSTLITDALASVIFEIKKSISDSKSLVTHNMFIKFMLDSESLFLSDDVDLSTNSSMQNPIMSSDYVVLWEPMLSFMFSENMIAKLVEMLVELVKSENESSKRKLRASQWLREIALALVKCKLSGQITGRSPTVSLSHEERLLQLLKQFPQHKNGLTLDLCCPVPKELTKMSFLHQILEVAHPHLKIYINEMLSLVEPPIPESSTRKILELVHIVSNVSETAPSDVIFTTEDLKNNSVHNMNGNILANDENLSMEVYDDVEAASSSIWQRASSDFIWGKCPLGILPWQQENNACINPLLP